jgi:DNA-binding NtrC family response regulator
MAHHWPGNVRELHNVIERATIVAKGDTIELSDLAPLVAPTARPKPSSGLTLAAGATVEDVERQLIQITLDHTGGNKTRAAEMLGMSHKTLHNKLNRMKATDTGGDA